MCLWVCIQVFPTGRGEFVLRHLAEAFMAELQYQIFDGNKICLHLCGGSVLMGSSGPPLLSFTTPPQKNSGEKIGQGQRDCSKLPMWAKQIQYMGINKIYCLLLTE